jgi:hypothetical protein
MPESYDDKDRSHIHINAFREEVAYQYPSRGQKRKPLRDDYAAHADHLLSQLAAALDAQPIGPADTRLAVRGLKLGTIVEVETMRPAEGSRKKAVKIPSNIEFSSQEVVVLRSERTDHRTESALLFVPDDARGFLNDRIASYGRDPGNQRRSDLDRFEVVEDVRAIGATALFTGDVDLAAAEVIWWEVWVRQPVMLADSISEVARHQGIDVHTDRLTFPDTTVIFLHAQAGDVANFSARIPGAILEIRRATGTIEPFLSGDGGLDQQDWVDDLAGRVIAPLQDSAVVCTLDTGIAAAHPLIARGVRGTWAYDDQWGADDHHPDGGHGTPLSGLILYGDLEPLMNDMSPVALTHGVESMKLLPPAGQPRTKPDNYGFVTQAAVAKVEAERPNALRSFCLASSTAAFPSSRPSSWSGALDQIISGSMLGDFDENTPANERPKRLVIVATGNVTGGMAEYVALCSPLEDPSQSWNALTVGGFTQKEQVQPPPSTKTPVVKANNRSPFSRGSQTLPQDLTPIKPEVLFEAGNMVRDDMGFCQWDTSVSLLSVSSNVVASPLTPFWATSAAAGMAGNFVGQLQSALPDLWPETHRALTVDSARWPEPIAKNFIGAGAHWKTGSKAKKQELLREFGYGVPNIQRAIKSARNDATMIAEAVIQPYAVGADRHSGVFNEMHFYDLPWPKAALEMLENEIVTMKVTLSYFIEPNLTGKAATRPDTYRSYGLRFDMKKRGETDPRFRSRISANQEKDGTTPESETSYWLMGPKAVQAGSLHCDLWRGYAADLALHDAIAVYPVGGWWKSHSGQNRVAEKARYALMISINAGGQNVNLHSEVLSLVEAKELEIQNVVEAQQA